MIYAVINLKGGVGKTSTALALSAGLSLKGYKVLSVDMDSQGNLTTAKGGSKGASVFGVLTGEVSALDAVQHTPTGDLIAASKALSGADATITNTGKEYRLREALEGLRGQYDYVVIDTPPSLGILTINALTACDRAVIVAEADLFSLTGITDVGEAIKPIKKYTNPGLKVSGILLTKFKSNATLHKDLAQVAASVAEKMGTTLFNAKIRNAVAVGEANIKKQSLFEYAPKAKVTEDYTAFINELIERERQ